MIVRLQLFAVVRQLVGRQWVEVDLPEPATVGSLREELARRFPEVESLIPHMLFAVGEEYAQDCQVIPFQAEVACIPPVSGG